MSLYNALFGVNRFAPLLLELLGTRADDVPRFRDCYINEVGEIVIHTRTGGSNRDFYDSKDGCDDAEYVGSFNEDLRLLPGFISDEDDDFDPTYADFRYVVPESAKDLIDELKTLGAVQNPGERWQSLLEKMASKDNSDQAVQRALSVGRKVLGEINAAALAGHSSPAVIKV